MLACFFRFLATEVDIDVFVTNLHPYVLLLRLWGFSLLQDIDCKEVVW